MSLIQATTKISGKNVLRCFSLTSLKGFCTPPTPSPHYSSSIHSHHARHFHLSQCRQYAQASPSAYRKSQPRRKNVDREGLVFSQSDVPPIDFWTQRVSVLAPQDLTAEDCFNAANKYCEVAVFENSTWKGRLQMDYGIDQYTLHYAALSLLGGEPGPTWGLGVHMLKTASDLGYSPSTLSLVGIITRTKPGSDSERQLSGGTMPMFDKLLRTGKNPDALTLKGLLLLRERDAAGALKYFNHAIKAAVEVQVDTQDASTRGSLPTGQVGSSSSSNPTTTATTDRAPRWNLEPACYLERGRLLLKSGREKDAEASFRVAALELDTADAYLELAKIMAAPLFDDDQQHQREEYLLKAAVSLNPQACSLVAEEELLRASSREEKEEAADPGRRRRDHQTMASEWFQLSGRADRAREVLLAAGSG